MPWGRVGSNLIMNLIQQSGPTKLANEPFNAIKGHAEQLAWYEEFYELSSEPVARRAIGSKLSVMSIDDPAELVARFLKDSLKIVRMRRDNVVKSAVSQIRAEQYANKTKEETGVASWAVRKGHSPLGPSIIEPALLLKRIAIMEREQNKMMSIVPSEAQVYEIEYTAVANDLQQLAGAMLDFLGLPRKRQFNIPFEKATPEDLREAIVNYEAVRQVLAQTPYSEFLDG
jgi:hypothetical protein